MPLQPVVSESRQFLGMEAVIASDSMRALMGTVERVAKSSATVLITGESGSGKELVARALHHYSMRTTKPWVDLSCAALPEHLIESELFGYDKGAFSGADTAKPGLFELAHTGTIFLDEIGELDARMQVKLLRVLDAVPYYRLGGVKKVSVDVRVIAATHRDLESAVAERTFRADLYHRLSQFVLRVPPLRDRTDDIAALAQYFLEQHDPSFTFSEDALSALQSHSWPGNIRELRNAVTKAALLCSSSEIQRQDLSLPSTGHSARNPVDGVASNGSLNGLERRAILDALAATGGHQSKAAEKLGISRRTLSRKLKTYEAEMVGVTS
jgi:DNA-binding NtrC family response regulator